MLVGSSVVCLELHCAARGPLGWRNSPEGCDSLRDLMPLVAAVLPTLQFLFISVPPRDADRTREPPPGKQYWWRIRGLGTERVAEPLDVMRGMRISTYLSSPAYDCTVAFDDEPAACLGCVSSLTITSTESMVP